MLLLTALSQAPLITFIVASARLVLSFDRDNCIAGRSLLIAAVLSYELNINAADARGCVYLPYYLDSLVIQGDSGSDQSTNIYMYVHVISIRQLFAKHKSHEFVASYEKRHKQCNVKILYTKKINIKIKLYGLFFICFRFPWNYSFRP